MDNQNDAADALLQQVIERLQQQAIPDFPNPELSAAKTATVDTLSVRYVSPLRRILMARRFQLSAGAIVAMAALLAFLVLWEGNIATPVSAMEQMAENVRKAKSYKCTQSVQFTFLSETGETDHCYASDSTVYWLAPGSARTETTAPSSEWKGPGPETTDIRPAGKPGIVINHQTKTYRRYPALQKNAYSSTYDDLEPLAKFSGEADRELDIKEINGKKARGFQIDTNKMDANCSMSGLAEIWIDIQSNLPVLVRYPGLKGLDYHASQQDTDIQWNIDLDPKLFDATPPDGYTDATPAPPTLDEQVGCVADALKIYAAASRGHYPAKFLGSERAVEDVCKMLGLTKWPNGEKEGNAAKALKALPGFNQITLIRMYCPDFAYNGKTVGPNDKDKILLRWKLDDSRYEVIFGDLRAETVTAERLRALEEK